MAEKTYLEDIDVLRLDGFNSNYSVHIHKSDSMRAAFSANFPVVLTPSVTGQKSDQKLIVTLSPVKEPPPPRKPATTAATAAPAQPEKKPDLDTPNMLDIYMPTGYTVRLETDDCTKIKSDPTDSPVTLSLSSNPGFSFGYGQ